MIETLGWIAIVVVTAFPAGGVAMALYIDRKDRNSHG